MERLPLLALVGALISLVAQSPLAQDKSAQQPVFRSGVDLATLDVTVVDKNGHPIAGLKPEDFVVTLNRQTRPVRALDFIETGVASSGPVESAAAAKIETKAAPRATTTRTVLILFDDLSYAPGRGRGLVQAGLRLLPSFGDGDVIGLATTSGLGPKVNPTRDHAAVAAALQSKALVGRDVDNTEPFYIGLDEALEIERDAQKQTLNDVVRRECLIVMPLELPNLPPQVDWNGPCPSLVEGTARARARRAIGRTTDQLAAYMAAIAALKPAHAPRVIVTLTAGLALSNEHGDLPQQMESVKHAASDAGVEFYALSDLADDVDARDRTPERAKARRTEGGFLDDGIHTLSSAAGGETFRVVGTADRFFARILTETSAFYRLGIELPESHPSQRFLSAKVTVARPGAIVRTNTEAIVAAVDAVPSAPAAAAAGAFDDQLRGALEQGTAASAVPITMTTALRRDPNAGGHLQLVVGAQIPASARGPLTAMFALASDTGAIVKQARVTVPSEAPGSDYLLTFPIPLDPGAYQLRFAVADGAGTIGLVTEPVAARLARIGPAYSASELMRTWTDTDGASHLLVLDTLPQAAVKFRVALELYHEDPTRPSTGMSVRLSLMSTTAVGEESPIATQTVVPVRKGPTLSVVADIPASAVPNGISVIHAIVLQDEEPVSEVSSAIQKLPSPASQRTTASFVTNYGAWVRGGAPSGFDLTVADLDALRGELARLSPTEVPMRHGATADETRESQRRLVTSVALETAAVGAKRHSAAAARLIEWACQYVRSHTPVTDFDRAWELAALAALEGAIDADGLRAHLGHLHGALADDPRVQLAHGIAEEQVNAPSEVLGRSLAGNDPVSAAERAIARYRDALNTPAIHAEAALRLGHVYLTRHRDDEALTAWKDVGEPPGDPALVFLARLFRGLAYEDLKRDDEARAAYQSAADLSPSAQSVNVRLALLAYRAGRAQESREIVEHLLQQHDPRADPWWSYYAADWRFWYQRISQVRGLLK